MTILTSMATSTMRQRTAVAMVTPPTKVMVTTTNATTVTTLRITTTNTMIKALMTVKNMMAVQATVMSIGTIPTTPAILMMSTTMANTTVKTIVMITNVLAHCFEFKSPEALCFVDFDWLIF